MIQMADILEFVRLEQQTQLAERQMLELLTEDTLEERGVILSDLTITDRHKNQIVLACPRNESRLRIGTKVNLLDPKGLERVVGGVITDLRDAGKTLHLQTERDASSLADGPWCVREADTDFSALLLQCLHKLQPGAPGWSFFKLLAGDMDSAPVYRRRTDEAKLESQLQGIFEELDFPLDESQRDAIRRCLQRPKALAIQGPPGTGKTKVLAIVAETLVRLGCRVAVVAPTHQAVNNALSSIRALFPTRSVIKIGDELRRESLDDSIQCKLLRTLESDLGPELRSETIIGITYLSALIHLALRTNSVAPNVLLVDEAGQLPLAQGICAGLTGAGSILMFGDDAQMPPVFATDLDDHPLAVSLFKQFRNVSPQDVRVLDTTYRLNGRICEIVSKTFYGEAGIDLHPSLDAEHRIFRLEPGNGVSAATRQALDVSEPFVWVRHTDITNRQSSPKEAECIAGLVVACMEAGMDSSQIVVVTPFRRQSALIRNRIQEKLPRTMALPIVDTVERVQGLTVELVMISMCASDPEYVSSIARFLFSPNRLNVAISRARSKVVITASDGALSCIPADFNGLLFQSKFKDLLSQAQAMLG
jgi:hypothetical protein